MNDESPPKGASDESSASTRNNNRLHSNGSATCGTGYGETVPEGTSQVAADVVTFDSLATQSLNDLPEPFRHALLISSKFESPTACQQWFDGQRDADRWATWERLRHCDGTSEAMVEAIKAKADPDTVKAHALIAAKDLPLTELGMARRLVATHGDTIRYAPQLGHWLVWDGRRWAEDVTGKVMLKAKAVVDELHGEALKDADRRQDLIKAWQRFQTDARLRAIASLATTEPGIPVLVDELDADPWLLNVENGIIDLRTGTLRPHDPNGLHTKFVPAMFDPDAACPTWERFLWEVFDGDSDVIDFVQRFSGYSLTGSVKEQMFVFCHGNGSNGKSTMLDVLRNLAGDYGVHIATSIITMSRHEQHPTGLMDLRGARLVTTVETEKDVKLAESLVKSLTGGDHIRARRMRQDFVEFSPSHKLWVAGNELPRITGTDYGIWRRIALVPFLQEFKGDRKDGDLPDKLAREFDGILAWVIRGCLEWQRDGLKVPSRVKAATDTYRTSQDHIGRFLADICVVDDYAYVTTTDLRAAYEAWCEEEGETPMNATALGRELTLRGFARGPQKGASRTRVRLGLGLLADDGMNR